MPVIRLVRRACSSEISLAAASPLARISESPCAADAHAPEAVLNSDDPRPKAAGSNIVEGDTRPRLCAIPRSPDKEGAAADVEGTGEASPCSAVGTAEVNCDSTVCVLVVANVPAA
jgi:hypothetical protein